MDELVQVHDFDDDFYVILNPIFVVLFKSKLFYNVSYDSTK